MLSAILQPAEQHLVRIMSAKKASAVCDQNASGCLNSPWETSSRLLWNSRPSFGSPLVPMQLLSNVEDRHTFASQPQLTGSLCYWFTQVKDHADLPSSELVPYDPSKFEHYQGTPLPPDEDARFASTQATCPEIAGRCTARSTGV